MEIDLFIYLCSLSHKGNTLSEHIGNSNALQCSFSNGYVCVCVCVCVCAAGDHRAFRHVNSDWEKEVPRQY